MLKNLSGNPKCAPVYLGSLSDGDGDEGASWSTSVNEVSGKFVLGSALHTWAC